jgi:hypothetical protein
VVCRTLKEQGLYPYHVQRVQALQPNRLYEYSIVLFADQAGFTRKGVFNKHDTHIQQHKSGAIQQGNTLGNTRTLVNLRDKKW